MWDSTLVSVRMAVYGLVASAALLMITAAVMAQSAPQAGSAPAVAVTLPTPVGARSLETEAAVKDRVSLLEESLRIQNAKLEALEKMIATQQRMIEELSSKPSNAVKDTTALVEPPVNPPTMTAAQTPSIDDRLKKVEGQVAKFGPFKLSGDFRLRLDSILRTADNNPPPGLAALTHQQNTRVRYRFRLNLDADVNDKLKFH